MFPRFFVNSGRRGDVFPPVRIKKYLFFDALKKAINLPERVDPCRPVYQTGGLFSP
jgi:hypothetical protein